MVMAGESMTFADNPARPWFEGPRPATAPGAGGAGMAVSGPVVEFAVQRLGKFLENRCADYRAIVVAPAGNVWRQKSHGVCRRGRVLAGEARGQRRGMTFDGVRTRCDQGRAASSRCRVARAHALWTHRDTPAVHAAAPFCVEQRVGNARFLGVQCTPQALAPGLREVLTGRDDGAVPVEHHQGGGGADALWFPGDPGGRWGGVQADALWTLRTNRGVASMERKGRSAW